MRWSIARYPLMLLAFIGFCTALAKKKQEPAQVEAPPEPVAAPVPTVDKLSPDGPPVAVQELPKGLANLSAQACNACHGEVHDAWQGSAHARAGSSQTYREAVLRAGGTPACTS